MKHIDIKRGLDILSASPVIDDPVAVCAHKVALVGSDYPRVKPLLAVSEGDHVALGEVLFTDRVHADLRFCAPGSGVVSAVHRGARRSLQAVVVDLDDDQDEVAVELQPGASRDTENIRATLLSTGLWSALRTRPYNSVPLPNAKSLNLFITAVDTNPFAPDPAPVILRNREAFVAGIEMFSLLSEHTFVCMGAAELPCPEIACVTPVSFAGPHPAGLPGTHIHHLAPHSTGIWHVGYQDVIAVGKLFLSGRMSVVREISLAGPGAVRPLLLRTRLGVAVADLTDQAGVNNSSLSSGSPLCGHTDLPGSGFLGRYHNQIWARVQAQMRAPAVERVSAWQSISALVRMFVTPGRALAQPTANLAAGYQTGMLAVEAFDKVWPFRVPPAPLLRALLTRDVETARRFAANMLVEEDLALCSYVCPARQDYASALRETLSELEQGD